MYDIGELAAVALAGCIFGVRKSKPWSGVQKMWLHNVSFNQIKKTDEATFNIMHFSEVRATIP